MAQPATVRVVALSADQQQAFDRAKNRVAESAIEFERSYFDEPFTFKFLPAMSLPAMEMIGRVQGMSASNDVGSLFALISEFMELMAMDDTAELIVELGRAGIMSMQDLIELQQAVVSAVAARPTVRSSSSSTGSSPDGLSSTASAPTETSTQQSSLSTGS